MITILLLEASFVPGGPDLNEEQLFLALDALELYHDHNRDLDNSVITFNPQKFNKSSGLWYHSEPNFEAITLDPAAIFDAFGYILDDLGLHNISQFVKEFAHSL